MKTYKFAVTPKRCEYAQIVSVEEKDKYKALRKVKTMFKDAKFIVPVKEK